MQVDDGRKIGKREFANLDDPTSEQPGVLPNLALRVIYGGLFGKCRRDGEEDHDTGSAPISVVTVG